MTPAGGSLLLAPSERRLAKSESRLSSTAVRDLMHLFIIPLLPLAGAAINGLLGKRFPKALVNAIALGSTAAAFGYALWIAAQFLNLPPDQIPHIEHYATWLASGPFRVEYGMQLDQLSLVMLLVVTGVGFLIHVYSIGYMAH